MKVYFSGFWGRTPHEEAGEPVEIEKEFSWYKSHFRIPAVYCCEKGIVMDLCREIPRDQIEQFEAKWGGRTGAELSPQEQEQRERENPECRRYRAALILNGTRVEEKRAGRIVWSETEEADAGGLELAEAYGCDRSGVWEFSRISFPWPEGERQTIRTLAVAMSARPVWSEGSPRFVTEAGCGGSRVRLRHPVSGAECDLEIVSCSRETYPAVRQEDTVEWPKEHLKIAEWPREYQRVVYRTAGEDQGLSLRDCAPSDEPRGKQEGAVSRTVLAAASDPAGKTDKTVFSSLHFDPVDRVQWRAMFPIVEEESLTVELKE